MTVDRRETFSDIVEVGLSPANLRIEPETSSFVMLNNVYRRSLSLIQGLYKSVSYVAHVFPWGALKVATYGSGFIRYEVDSGSQPAAFSASNEIAAASGYFHRFDITVKVQPAEIRFYLDETESWGDAIPVPVGTSSIEFTSSKIQIKYETATGGTYTMVAYQ